MLPLKSPPTHICLLRLSAIGDVSHLLPIVRTIQHTWPETKITWIIGKREYQLVQNIRGIEFVIFDKSLSWKAYLKVWQHLRKQEIDVLLHMQVSLRANLLSIGIKAPIKLGYDRLRSKDGHYWFCNQHITHVEKQHVIDSFFEFTKTLGIEQRYIKWDIPLQGSDIAWVEQQTRKKNYVVINPSTSQRANNWRNWETSRYSAIVDYIAKQYQTLCILSGGPAKHERLLAQKIIDATKHKEQVINLVGKTELQQLTALLDLAELVISPDTGPAHIANAMGTPVIGLYASSNPYRTGPYNSLEHTVNCYPKALKQFENMAVNTAPWGKRVRNPEALDLLSVEDVMTQVDKLLHQPQ